MVEHMKKPKCRWGEDEDGNWETCCAETFFFVDGGPTENRFLFCPYCGGELRAVKWRPGKRSIESPRKQKGPRVVPRA